MTVFSAQPGASKEHMVKMFPVFKAVQRLSLIHIFLENDTKEKVALTEEQEQALLSFIKTDNVYPVSYTHL